MLKRVDSTIEFARACELCGSHSATEIEHYTKGKWPVVECGDCGFVFLGEVPPYSALVEEFAWEKTFETEKKRRRKSRFGWLDAVTRYRTRLGHVMDHQRRARTLGMTGNVLDVGCGVNCRIPDGPTPFGIEISAALAKQAAPSFEQRGGRVVHAPATEGFDDFPDGFFSAVLMRSFLEHESQPRLVLQRAFRKLAPGGAIYVRVPDYGSVNRRLMGSKWCGFRFPDHVNYFTSRSLRKLAENVGFVYSRTNWLSAFDDNIIAVLKKPTRMTSNLHERQIGYPWIVTN